MPDLLLIALLLALLLFAAGVGAFVRTRLPERHLSPESIQLVQATITLLVTFTAIVLGLLTTSVKADFDAANAARGKYASDFVQLDQCLRDLGPETAKMRDELKSYIAAVIASTWPDEPPPKGVSYPDTSKMPLVGESEVLGNILYNVDRELRSLQPSDPVRRSFQLECEQQFSDLMKDRWTVIEQSRGSISAPFYWVMVLWLVILFASLGVCAPANPLTTIVVALSAVSITIVVFVVLDLDIPYGGLFSIPSMSMRDALADMMR